MTKKAILAWLMVASAIAAVAALVILTIVLWPPSLVTGILIAALALLPSLALFLQLHRQRNHSLSLNLQPEELARLSETELGEYRLQMLADFERRLELRELRLARQIRTSQYGDKDYIDLLQPDPSDEELDALVGNDRKLIALIEEESRLAFNRIRKNRYALGDGVNSALIFQDLRAFVEKVAALYHPESGDILLETEIELLVKSFSSASLHLLLVVDDLPLNLKAYNTAKMYRLIRRGAAYYGTYKAFRPYLEQGLNALQLARLALGMNPIAVGVAWLAGKLTTHGAMVVGERLLQRKALQLLTDFIRVIGYEAAMVYGGDFGHRDANWIFGAELVNLEISRGSDYSGRDAALNKLCKLVLRNEFDRMRLLTNLAQHKAIKIERARSRIVMTSREREDISAKLVEHCEKTNVNLNEPAIVRWQKAAESILEVNVRSVPSERTQRSQAIDRPRSSWLKRSMRRLRRKSKGARQP